MFESVTVVNSTSCEEI